MVHKAIHLVGQGIIHDIRHDIDILAAGRIIDDTLALAGSETDIVDPHTVVVLLIVGKRRISLDDVVEAAAESRNIVIDLCTELPCGRHHDQPQGSERNLAFKLLMKFQIRHWLSPCRYCPIR